LFRQTGDKIVACLDNNVGYYCIDSVNVAQLKEKYRNNLIYFLGLLNSRLINFFYQQISQEAGRVLAQVKPQRIRSLPIAYPDIQQQQAIASFVEQIIDAKLANQMADTHELEEKIDQMVYKLYGLTEEEIKIVEDQINVRVATKSILKSTPPTALTEQDILS
jgi:adenine-specific DNA-methyltransferase